LAPGSACSFSNSTASATGAGSSKSSGCSARSVLVFQPTARFARAEGRQSPDPHCRRRVARPGLGHVQLMSRPALEAVQRPRVYPLQRRRRTASGGRLRSLCPSSCQRLQD
jgi:hypothetical protein